VNDLEQILGEDWQVSPAGGATGEAYIAEYGSQKLFLKRNSSPFLAVLSAEGIVPKLLWTKRLGNGDVITAQQWLEGRELKAPDMMGENVATLLAKIHRSQELLGMMNRLEKKRLLPIDLLNEIQKKMSKEKKYLEIINDAFAYLMETYTDIETHNMVVCHCDVNHNNWLLSDTNELFLIDWDGAMIADPALDLGMLLYSYIPYEKWEHWLDIYGQVLDDDLERRMYWYVLAQTIISYFWYKEKGQSKETAHFSYKIRELACTIDN
jgi:thiamine kinase-like enzyme